VLVGSGSLRQHIEQKVINNGLTESVNFLGNRLDVDYLLQGFDILLMPSLYEGLPYVALEAQAAGLPILAADTIDSETNIVGTVEFLNLKMSSTAWAMKITEIISEDYNRADIKHINEEFVRHGYALKKTIRRIQQLYLK
jgi:Glycosyltransferase